METQALPDATNHELSLSRLIDAPPEKLFRAWTEPDLIVQWFAPHPWCVEAAEMDVRPGGRSRIVMRGPDGAEAVSEGVYLEVVPNRRLVFTDAYAKAWQPSAHPFLTILVDFVPVQDKTHYVARARHWTAEDLAHHEQLGFHKGWALCVDQLTELVARL